MDNHREYVLETNRALGDNVKRAARHLERSGLSVDLLPHKTTNMDWLRAERPSESTLAYSVETLLFSIIARCLRYVGEPVDVRAGLLSKEHVWAIISSVCLELDEIKKENEMWREAEIVTKAAHLGLAQEASNFTRGIWIARCPGTNHTLELQPKRNLFYCGYCKVGGGIDKLDEFVAQRRSPAGEFIGGRTLH